MLDWNWIRKLINLQANSLKYQINISIVHRQHKISLIHKKILLTFSRMKMIIIQDQDHITILRFKLALKYSLNQKDYNFLDLLLKDSLNLNWKNLKMWDQGLIILIKILFQNIKVRTNYLDSHQHNKDSYR